METEGVREGESGENEDNEVILANIAHWHHSWHLFIYDRQREGWSGRETDNIGYSIVKSHKWHSKLLHTFGATHWVALLTTHVGSLPASITQAADWLVLLQILVWPPTMAVYMQASHMQLTDWYYYSCYCTTAAAAWHNVTINRK